MGYSRATVKTELPVTKELSLDEWKACLEEGRFAMTRYMQMLAIYVAFTGLLFRELFAASELPLIIMWFSVAAVLNGLVYYAAVWFRSMAYHNLDRAELLANHLGLQAPHPMLWGYWLGLFILSFCQIAVTGFLFWSIAA